MTDIRLITTEVARQQQIPKESTNTFNPAKLFAKLSQEKRIWIATTVLVGLIALLEPFVILRMLNKEEKAIILDPAGTYYISPVVSFQKAVEIQKNIGNLASFCLFSLNPSGYDFPEVIEDLFIGPAQEKLVKEWEENKAVFAEKNLHQKPELFATTVLKAEANFILVKIEGQVIRVGGFEGAEILHAQPFSVQLILNKNPNLIRSGKYPFTVCDFQYTYL